MSSESSLSYPYTEGPEYGTAMEVAPGVKWLQMPLPMSLQHINLYLIEDHDGWVVVDTGIRGEETQLLWHQVFDQALEGKPVKQIICTHMHPDHTGQAGFISEHWKAPLYMSHGEYYQARVMSSQMMSEGGNWQMSAHFIRNGIEPDFLEELRAARSSFSPQSDDLPLPAAFIRLQDGETLSFMDREWQVLVGVGHSPEHVCLYCPSLRLLISGDQILPVVTSNVSVHPNEPEANPLVGWLASHEKFKALLPDDIMVLPAHNLPFYGVQERLQQLIDHHEDRMLIVEESCVEPQKPIDLLPALFARQLDGFSKMMALGECVAHIHCLLSRGRLSREDRDGVYFYRSIDPTLKDRATPGHHESRDAIPEI